MSCPDEMLSGLVDGELSHPEREQVLGHLLDCTACRTEVEALRILKARLQWAGAETPLPDPALVSRLHALVVPGVQPATVRPRGVSRPVTVHRARRAGSHPGGLRHRRLRQGAVGGCLIALGLGAAFLLGGSPPTRSTQVPVNPGTNQFVVDYVTSTGEVPLTDPLDAAVVGTSR